MLLRNIAIFLRFLSISYCFQEIYIMLEVIIFPLYNILNYVLHYWVINKMKIVNFGNTWYKTALGQDQNSASCVPPCRASFFISIYWLCCCRWLLPGLGGFAQSQPGWFWAFNTGVLTEIPDLACALLQLVGGLTNVTGDTTCFSTYVPYIPL